MVQMAMMQRAFMRYRFATTHAYKQLNSIDALEPKRPEARISKRISLQGRHSPTSTVDPDGDTRLLVGL
jgi:hypothetical protein